MSVLADFFQNEFDGSVQQILVQKLSTGRAAYLTFNIFNVRIDPDVETVTIDDVLDPERSEKVDLPTFRQLVAQGSMEFSAELDHHVVFPDDVQSRDDLFRIVDQMSEHAETSRNQELAVFLRAVRSWLITDSSSSRSQQLGGLEWSEIARLLSAVADDVGSTRPPRQG